MNPKRAMLALLLVNIIIQTGASLKERQAPRPSRYVAITLVFLILGTISDTIPRAAKTATMFAALFTLTVALRVVAGQPYGVQVATAPVGYVPSQPGIAFRRNAAKITTDATLGKKVPTSGESSKNAPATIIGNTLGTNEKNRRNNRAATGG